MAEHYQEVCFYGTVHAQCRCANSAKSTRRITCPTPEKCAPTERTCTSTHHVFREDPPVSLTEGGESAACQCGNVAAALRDGQIAVTVRAMDLNLPPIPVSITPVRSVLSPGDTVEAKVNPHTTEWTTSGCSLEGCTFPGQHNHGTD